MIPHDARLLAASTITNYTGSITKPPLEAPFQGLMPFSFKRA
jgi:hypothetical protein